MKLLNNIIDRLHIHLQFLLRLVHWIAEKQYIYQLTIQTHTEITVLL